MANHRVAIGGYFELTDHLGTQVTSKTYRGRYLLVFFGFTHCRQICPAVLNRNSEALELLGSHADRIMPLYITVDPERDTPAVLADFLTERHPRYIGLTGTPETNRSRQTEVSRRLQARR
jgi:protein SCO1/2